MSDDGIELPYPPGHFYSPIPDPRRLSREPDRSRIWPEKPHPTPGIDWRDREQLDLCRRLAAQPDLVFPPRPTSDPHEYAASSKLFPQLDALVLQAMLRHLRPRRMIEAGAGYSSLVTARVNRELLDGGMHFSCIDPYPPDFLREGVSGISEVREEEIQQTPLELFERLEDGDVFFIDSSHTAKTGSDVPWIFHQVIPRLNPGVVVHVHDAFLPGDYPMQWVLSEGLFWNEIYVLHSFLTFNSEFEVLLGVQYLVQNHPRALFEAFDQLRDLGPNAGGSLWIRRVK